MVRVEVVAIEPNPSRIRVELVEQVPYAAQVPGTKYEVRNEYDETAPRFDYVVTELGISGRSREPLLDACRQIVALGDGTSQREIGLYEPGKATPRLICTSAAYGAQWTVRETKDIGPVFVRWRPFKGIASTEG